MGGYCDVVSVLELHRDDIGLVLPTYQNLKFFIIDLSKNNPVIPKIATDPIAFTKYIEEKMNENKAKFCIGRYNENRCVYDQLELFGGTTRRTVHIGTDLHVPVDTEVLAPIDGKVHSFKNNNNPGDYGPTIILEHELDNIQFYTLYGHLSTESLKKLDIGKEFRKGERIAWIGKSSENGGYPPHLHFQIITDMRGMEGDYPGVVSMDDRQEFLHLCPDPNFMLNIDGLWKLKLY